MEPDTTPDARPASSKHAWGRLLQRINTDRGPRLFGWLLLLGGILTRTVQYLHNRSLWLDESFVALNIINRSYADLMGPLEYAQVVPPGFLLVVKFITLQMGTGELALRLFPFLCGIASLFLFYYIARRVLQPGGALVALFLFAVSPYLVYYASEVKQYGVEATVTLLLIALAVQVYRSRSPEQWLPLGLLAIMGAVAPWFSFSAPLVLAGVGLTLGFGYLSEKAWKQGTFLIFTGVLWVVSFVILYLAVFRATTSNTEVQHFWDGILPVYTFSMQGLRFLIDRIFGNLAAALEKPLGFGFQGLAAMAFLLGMWSLFKRSRWVFFLLVSPVLLTLFAYLLRQYPFHERLLLFLAPLALLLVAEGIGWTWGKTRLSAPLIGLALALLLLVPEGYDALIHLRYPPLSKGNNAEEMRPVAAFLKETMQTGDALYLYPMAEGPFRYYAHRFDMADRPYNLLDIGEERSLWGVIDKDDWNTHLAALEEVRGHDRAWILLYPLRRPDVRMHRDIYLDLLDTMGTRVGAFGRESVVVYLYSFKDTPPAPEADARP